MIVFRSKVYFAVFCLILVYRSASAAKELPKYLPNCHRYDKHLNSCLVEATEKVKPFLAKGIPELGLPAFEPFIIPEINLEQGTSALNFKAKLKNTEIYGLTNYTFSKFDFDVPNLQFFCECTINNLQLRGNYSVTGKILVAPIVGSGTFTASVENCNATVYQKVKVEKRKGGLNFIVPTHTNSSINVSGPKANLQGLFDNNSDLSKITNKVINDNVNELFEDLKPVLEKVLSDILEDLLFKAIEGQIPYDKLYPPIP
ncbi:unnamed protein product [Psylliodes chrysocephalus]|uniref:Uncharacterized protein n=1 Tax=Psylliodes chrysocephalus TaxID=3402493 RepID=A0A9P0CE21_9CUCU|nr:unnamed protein product [Psylliodes chrysocephala]